MLQNIRDNSQGWIAKTIIGVIVALMALTGFDAIFQATSTSKDAAKVNGEEITQTELSQAVDMQRRQLMQQLGKDFDASLLDEKMLREAALKGLIDRKLLLQGANQAKFSFSEAALDQVILQTPEFQADGKFSPERFDQVIRQLGYGRLQFRDMLAEEMLIGQLRAGLAGSGFVTDEQVNAFARLEKQTRDFASLNIKADPAAVKLTDDEVKAYTSSLTSSQKAAYEHFGISANDISAVAEVKTVKVLSGVGDKDAIAQKNVEFAEHPEIITLVKIGHQWYVDFTADID